MNNNRERTTYPGPIFLLSLIFFSVTSPSHYGLTNETKQKAYVSQVFRFAPFS